MMMVLYSPQRSDTVIEYTFDGEKITVAIDGQTDIFDFTSLGVGDEIEEIITSLPINPVIDAKRKEDNKLYVTLLKFYGKDATIDELFPDWEEV